MRNKRHKRIDLEPERCEHVSENVGQLQADLDEATAKLLRSGRTFGLEDLADHDGPSMLGRHAPVVRGNATPISMPRSINDDGEDLVADEPPDVVNAAEPTGAVPASLTRMQKLAWERGWATELVWGHARQGKRRQREDAEAVKLMNSEVKKSQQRKTTHQVLIDVYSVSLRMRRGDERLYGLWINGSWDHGGMYRCGDLPLRLSSVETRSALD